MGCWADHAIAELTAGRSVQIRPRGHSMRPKVLDGASVTLAPIADPAALKAGDIVLVRVGGAVYLHLVSACDRRRVQISNNRGRVNGWVARTKPFGIAVHIDNRP